MHLQRSRKYFLNCPGRQRLPLYLGLKDSCIFILTISAYQAMSTIKPRNSRKNWRNWLESAIAALLVIQVQGASTFSSSALADEPAYADRLRDRTTLQRMPSPVPQHSQSPRPMPSAWILQNYQNQIYQLVKKENLKGSAAGSQTRDRASTKTLSTLKQLDGQSKAKLLKFLEDSNLIFVGDAVISLIRADLSSADLSSFSLSNADLREADLSNTTLTRANLSGAMLFQANLGRTDASFANFSGAELFRANLRDSNLLLANLSGAKAKGADLGFADLFLANLRGVNLSNANLGSADLSYANLSGAELAFANFAEANLAFANLRGAKLNGADLSGASLVGADLQGVDLSGASLRNADLSKAKLEGANLFGADLSGALLANTTMPDGKIKK